MLGGNKAISRMPHTLLPFPINLSYQSSTKEPPWLVIPSKSHQVENHQTLLAEESSEFLVGRNNVTRKVAMRYKQPYSRLC